MSKKRIQIFISDEAWEAVGTLTSEANEDFEYGSIHYSDIINELLINNPKIDVKGLQLKHTDLRRSLKTMASKDSIDLDLIIKTLNELKQKGQRKPAKQQSLPIETIRE